MTGFRNSRYFLLAFVAGFLGWSLAWAQDDMGAGKTLRAEPAILGKHGENSVTVNALGNAEPPIGLLNENNGGLSPDMWANATRADIETLIPKAPLATQDRFVRAMSRIVILSESEAPRGEGVRPLIMLRLKALLDVGLLSDAGSLAVKAERKNDTAFDRLRAAAILFAGMDGDACSDATATRLTSSDLFWLKLRAACFAIAGDNASLELVRAVLAQHQDPAFDTLLEDLVEKKKNPPGIFAAPDAVDLFLLRKAGLPIDENVAGKLGIPGTVLAMRSAMNPIDLRMRLAQQLVPTSGLIAADLSALAQAQPLTDTKRAHAPSAAIARDLVHALINLHSRAEHEGDPARKAAAAELAFRRGLKDGAPDLAALYFADITGKIKPSIKLKMHALAMAQMLLIIGKADTAAGWYALFSTSAPGEAAARALVAAELNIVAQSSSARPDGEAAQLWFAQQISNPAAAPKEAGSGSLVLRLHDALGLPMPREVEVQLATLSSAQNSGRRPSQQLMDDITASAGKAGHQGETVLQILVAIGPNGASELAPDVTATMVRTLKKIGLPVAARDLALSALLHQPLPAQVAPLQ